MSVYPGNLLTATPAPVSASPTSTRTWQWLRNNDEIPSATSSTYRLTTADINAALSVRQTETNVAGVTSATSAQVGPIQTYSPSLLFAAGEQGAWYDPSDLTTMFQDNIGTTPVTGTGQAVGLLLDKSKGLALGSELVTNGGFDSGSTGWTVQTGWSISGGVASYDGTAASNAIYQSGITLTSGVSYRVTVTVTRTAGALLLRPTRTSTTGAFQITASGTYSVVLVGLGGNFGIVSGEFGGSFFNGTIDNISVRELAGNHAVQATAANRPIYGVHPFGGRRNLGLMTSMTSVTGTAGSQFPNATGWANFFNTGGTRTYVASSQFPGDQALDVSGVSAARNVIGYSFTPLASTTYTVSFWIEAVSGVTGIVSYVTGTLGTGGTTNSISAPTATGRVSYTFTTGTSSGVVDVRMGIGSAGNESGSIRISGFQVELGSTATAYQRVTDQYNVTEAGVASVGYLFFDGANDSMSTSSVDFSTGPTNPTLGSELVVNGDFSNGSTGWTLNAGWAVSSSTLVSTAAAAGTSAFQALVGLKPNTTYRVTFDISGYSAGFVYAQFFAGGESSPWQSGNGPKTVFITTPSSVANNNFGLTAVFAAFTGTIDNVSVREIDATQVPNKMTVFAGVRKLSDAASMLLELSANSGSNARSFYVYNDSNTRIETSLNNGSGVFGYQSSAVAAPASRVLTTAYDIAGTTRDTEITQLRLNGVQDRAVLSGGSFVDGTGVFGNYPLYIGYRQGTGSLFFSGHLYSLIVRGASSSSILTSATEGWVASKTGVVIA